MSDFIVHAEFPPKLINVLFRDDLKYIVIPGGRGGSRSWSVARALLIRGTAKKLLILCVRETQSSIEQSVHRLLSDQITNLHLESFYKINNNSITGLNGTEIVFAGIRRNFAGLKSFEGADICWIEEGEAVTEPSWRYLIPTIRKKDAIFYVTFNPQLATDETYERFIINSPPRTEVITMNYYDNPWFDETSLREEMEHLKKIDEPQYRNVWLGEVKEYLDGAIFAPQIKQTIAEGRIKQVNFDPTKPVNTYWDMGRDGTAIWFAQNHDNERYIINYYENIGESISHYTEKLQELVTLYHYQWGKHYIPHDGSKGWWGSEYNIREVMGQFLGEKNIIQLPKSLAVEDRINAGRMIFPLCYFDEVKTKVGMQCLRSYRYLKDAMKPDHDHASHGADAFTALAMASNQKPRTKIDMDKVRSAVSYSTKGGWLGT